MNQLSKAENLNDENSKVMKENGCELNLKRPLSIKELKLKTCSATTFKAAAESRVLSMVTFQHQK